MYRVPGVLSASPARAGPQARPAAGPPPGRPPAPEDSGATADLVIRRLLTAGHDLQAALGLMGDHPASAQIRQAADELDQAIRDMQVVPERPSADGLARPDSMISR